LLPFTPLFFPSFFYLLWASQRDNAVDHELHRKRR
jgi:hypothetical protein